MEPNTICWKTTATHSPKTFANFSAAPVFPSIYWICPPSSLPHHLANRWGHWLVTHTFETPNASIKNYNYIFHPKTDGLASDSSSFDTSFALDPQLGGARETSPDFVDLNNQIEEARLKSLALDEKRQVIQDKIAKKKKKEDRRKKSHSDNDQQLIDTTNGHQSSESAISVTMSEVEISEAATLKPRADQQALDDDENDRKAEEERRKNRETPVIFSDIDVSVVEWTRFFNCTTFF